MAQSLRAIETPNGPPYSLSITLTCDGQHGLLQPLSSTWVGDDYIALRKMATEVGWRRIDGGSWRGPCCRAGRESADA